jgi:hypothetical protein
MQVINPQLSHSGVPIIMPIKNTVDFRRLAWLSNSCRSILQRRRNTITRGLINSFVIGGDYLKTKPPLSVSRFSNQRNV